MPAPFRRDVAPGRNRVPIFRQDKPGRIQVSSRCSRKTLQRRSGTIARAADATAGRLHQDALGLVHEDGEAGWMQATGQELTTNGYALP